MCESVAPTVFDCDEEPGGQNQVVDMVTQVIAADQLSGDDTRDQAGTDVFLAEDEECTIELSLQHTGRQLVFIHAIVSRKDECSVPPTIVEALLRQLKASAYWDEECPYTNMRTQKLLQAYIQQVPDRVDYAVGSLSGSKIVKYDFEMQELATFDQELDRAALALA